MSIVLLKLNDKRDVFSTVPKGMRDEIVKKIGSEFAPKSRDTIRGLNPQQEKAYLPQVIGLQPTDPQFPNKTRDFWADYTIQPTPEGIRLNIATTKGVDDEGKDIIIPESIEDYMVYQFAMKSSKVAKTDHELSNLSMYDFYLEDLSKIKRREESEYETREKADIAYSKFVTKMETSMDKVNLILEMMKEKGTYFDIDIEEVDKKIMLRKHKEKEPRAFLALVDDPALEQKAFISECISYLVLTKEGNDIFNQDENIGSMDLAAIAWLKKAENSTKIAAIKARLQSAKENKKQKQ